MLALVQHLIRGGRFDRERSARLGRLLARFEAQPGPRQVGPRVRAMAAQVLDLKRRLSAAIGDVRACTGCARDCAGPSGAFDGGRCCGTSTLEVFTQGEVRAMKIAGIRPPVEPASDGAPQAGCIFRGARGCSLPPEARPARCLVYVCHELRQELEPSPRAARIHALRAELDDAFAELERASA